ncbi:calcium-binding protein CAST-like [Cynara cardunculus var. scolymus]|uniref:Calcium-binding EF-hand n=1 Tax=Cynara cardunculus var. scolymus TaxID=59895 RepID=A0A103DTX5_CYNCS|nr:calcium-binding protein CAST-like [Cynara cardunculus var. scolymus]KVE10363.1 Calcium-binding EF-hand [Cynara cardunculus var. scolymus]
METSTTTAQTQSDKKSLLKSSSSITNSFRLRSPSLNSVRLRRIFDLFDTDHDSLISVDELSRALVLLGLETDIRELDSMIKSYIQPDNDGLTFDDFQALHKSLGELFFEDAVGDDEDTGSYDSRKQEEVDLTEAFKVFDEDGDGYISAKELQVVLEKLGFAEASEMGRVEMMISSVDRNADGVVDFSEFKEMMKNIALK